MRTFVLLIIAAVAGAVFGFLGCLSGPAKPYSGEMLNGEQALEFK